MEKVTSGIKKAIRVKTADLSTIQPFAEKASAQRGRPEADTKNYLCASSLFSLFTADIIRQEKEFVR